MAKEHFWRQKNLADTRRQRTVDVDVDGALLRWYEWFPGKDILAIDVLKIQFYT